jgi:hypothetical protein
MADVDLSPSSMSPLQNGARAVFTREEKGAAMIQ